MISLQYLYHISLTNPSRCSQVPPHRIWIGQRHRHFTRYPSVSKTSSEVPARLSSRRNSVWYSVWIARWLTRSSSPANLRGGQGCNPRGGHCYFRVGTTFQEARGRQGEDIFLYFSGSLGRQTEPSHEEDSSKERIGRSLVFGRPFR